MAIKTVIFDLDGTIYQNNEFHRDYIHFLLEGSDKTDWEDALVAYVDEVYRGRGLVMNAFYDGREIPAQSPAELFRAMEAARLPDSAQDEGVYLGDAWAVVTFIGSVLGLLRGTRADEIYKKTRDKMSLDGMRGNVRLRQAILALKQTHRTVLMTNSYRQTAEDFLRQLDFENVFDCIVFSAGKPWQAVENLKKSCPKITTEPETFLTVGDNAFNDLTPFRALGCKTLWVNPFTDIHEPKYDYSVKTLEELAQFLETLYRKSNRLL